MMKRPKYITTLDEGGLLVAIPNVVGKRGLTKTFRPSEGELPEQLIAKATVWRDRAYKKLYREAVPERSFHKNARQDSGTGIPGVRVIEKTTRKGDKTFTGSYAIALVHTVKGNDYVKPSGARTKLFSLNKYGRDGAIKLAAEWREQQIKLNKARQAS